LWPRHLRTGRKSNKVKVLIKSEFPTKIEVWRLPPRPDSPANRVLQHKCSSAGHTPSHNATCTQMSKDRFNYRSITQQTLIEPTILEADRLLDASTDLRV